MNRARQNPEHEQLLSQTETNLSENRDSNEPPAKPASFGTQGLAQALLAEARRRAQVFGDLEFHDPQWLMLLDLFVAGRQSREICVTSLCIASGVPTTTALRHIAFLQKRGLVRKCSHQADSRRSIVSLTDEATERMFRYLVSAEQFITSAG